MSKRYAKYINDPRSLWIKATFSCKVNRGIHTQENGLQSGVRSCIMPGLAAHYVQELNVGTAHEAKCVTRHVGDTFLIHVYSLKATNMLYI